MFASYKWVSAADPLPAIWKEIFYRSFAELVVTEALETF